MYCYFCNSDRYDLVYSIKFKQLNILYACAECTEREILDFTISKTIPITHCMYCEGKLPYDEDKYPVKIIKVTSPHNETIKEKILMNAMCIACCNTQLGLRHVILNYKKIMSGEVKYFL